MPEHPNLTPSALTSICPGWHVRKGDIFRFVRDDERYVFLCWGFADGYCVAVTGNEEHKLTTYLLSPGAVPYITEVLPKEEKSHAHHA